MSSPEAEAVPHVKEAHKPVEHVSDKDGAGKNGLAAEAAKLLSTAGGNEAARNAAKHHDKEAIQKPELTIVLHKGSGAGSHSPITDAAAHNLEHRPAKVAGDDAPAKPLKIVDKTVEHSETFKAESETKLASAGKAVEKLDTPPKITVGMQSHDKDGSPDSQGSEDKKKPHFAVKKDGTVEMYGDPALLKSKEVRIEVEREPGEINPTKEQLDAANQLVSKVSADLQTNFPTQAGQIVLDDQGDLISRKTEQASDLKPPPSEAKLPPETRESVEQTKRLRHSGGVDMPHAATERMGSFETRHVPRQKNETDETAALKESWAGLFKPDKTHPYETIRKEPDGETKVGRYGFNGRQLESWLNGLTTEEIGKLIAEGKLSRDFANPEFIAQFKQFAERLKNGEQPTEAELKRYLPEVAQETIAGKLLTDMDKAMGADHGMTAAALISGKTVDTVDDTFKQSDEAKELSEAGKTLYDIAARRQYIEGDGNSAGRLPEGNRLELITKALEIAGQPVNQSNIRAVNTIVQHESGWNPGITNNWDSNAQKGTPSQGLMQTIPPTFNSYRDRSGAVEEAGHSNSIKDPLANLVAGIRYAASRYGSIQRVPGVRSLALNGSYKPY